MPKEALGQSYDVLRDAAQKLDPDGVINSPAQALNVFDFEPAAKKALTASPAHFGYLASGVDDDSTLRANREAFSDYTIRVRRLVDARKVDTKVRIFGETWDDHHQTAWRKERVSVWQTPVAAILTRICPGPAAGTGTSSIVSGFPNSWTTAAFMVVVIVSPCYP